MSGVDTAGAESEPAGVGAVKAGWTLGFEGVGRVDVVGPILFVFVIPVGVVGLMIIGAMLGIEQEQKKASAAGVGRWHIDPQTGEREFRYGRDGE